MKATDVTGSCEKQPGKLSCCLICTKLCSITHSTHSSLQQVNAQKQSCYHKQVHERIIYSRPIFHLICLYSHINAYNFISTVPSGLEPTWKVTGTFWVQCKFYVKEIWLIQTWTNTELQITVRTWHNTYTLFNNKTKARLFSNKLII